MPLRSARERLIQTLAFEAGGLALCVPLYGLASGRDPQEGAMLMAVLTLAVMIWSPLHNTLFDALDLRLTGRPASDRGARLRIVHALSHEASAVAVSLPILLTLGGHSLGAALMVNLGLTVLYTAYAYVFHLAYDQLRPVTLAV